MILQERDVQSRTTRLRSGILRLLLLGITMSHYTFGQDNLSSVGPDCKVIPMFRAGAMNSLKGMSSATSLEFNIPDQYLRQIFVNASLDRTVGVNQDLVSQDLTGSVGKSTHEYALLVQQDTPNLTGEQDTTSAPTKEMIRRMVAEEFKQHRRATMLSSVIVGIPTGILLGVKFAQIIVGDPVGPWTAVSGAVVALSAVVVGATVTPILLYQSIKTTIKYTIKKRLFEEMKEDSQSHFLKEKTNWDDSESL